MVTQIKDSGIQFHPRKGTVLICDFKGHEVPEIVKKRPVVVITPRLPYRDNLATVVPLSTTPPEHDVPYVVKLKGYYGNDPLKPQQYAKCDLVCAVSFKRLDRVKVGFRKFISPELSNEDLDAVLNGVRSALGLF
jgi:uncharacterized protein YifN (PemK superfamily)